MSYCIFSLSATRVSGLVSENCIANENDSNEFNCPKNINGFFWYEGVDLNSTEHLELVHSIRNKILLTNSSYFFTYTASSNKSLATEKMNVTESVAPIKKYVERTRQWELSTERPTPQRFVECNKKQRQCIYRLRKGSGREDGDWVRSFCSRVLDLSSTTTKPLVLELGIYVCTPKLLPSSERANRRALTMIRGNNDDDQRRCQWKNDNGANFALGWLPSRGVPFFASDKWPVTFCQACCGDLLCNNNEGKTTNNAALILPSFSMKVEDEKQWSHNYFASSVPVTPMIEFDAI